MLLGRSVVGDAGLEGPYAVVPASPAWVALGTDYLTFTQTIVTTGPVSTATYQSTARLARDPFAPAALNPLKTQFNFVQGNSIGTDSVGMRRLGNSASGIRVDQGAAFTGIGFVVRPNPLTGAAELDGAANIVSGNGAQGILVRGVKTFSPNGIILDAGGNSIDPDTVYTVIQGNTIGLAADGITPLGNGGSGVVVTEGARGNSVGSVSFDEALLAAEPGPGGITLAQAFRNVISGNAGNGVEVSGTDQDPQSLSDPIDWYDGITLRNFVSGNYIGVSAAGSAAVGNAGSGVVVRQGARSNGIGGFSTLQTPSVGNLIGGNGQHGILVENTRQAPQLLPLPGPMVLEYQVANHNTFSGNLIGANAAGVRLANGGDGIALVNASGEEIGGIVLEGGNVVSGNDGNGIRISGPQSAKNLIVGNYVGTSPLAVAELQAQPDLAAAPLGNGLAAIVLEAGAHDNRLTALISTAKANYNLGNLLVSGLIALDSYQSLRARFHAESVEIPGVTDPFNFEMVAGPGGYQLITTPAPLRVMASRNTVEGASGSGIVVTGAGTIANRVQSAYVGTDRLGALRMAADGSPLNANQGIGILVSDEAAGTILGAESTHLLFRSNRAFISPSGLAVHLSFDPADVDYLEVAASQRWWLERNLVVANDSPASNPWSLPSDPSAGSFAGGPYVIAEGQSLALDASATPASLGPLAFAWDLSGDLDFADSVGPNPMVSWTHLLTLGVDDAPQTRNLWLQVTDSSANVGYRAATLIIENSPPQLTLVPVTADEVVRGQMYSLTLAANDPSPADQMAGFTFEIDWNGDTIWDEIVTGPAGMVVSHAFSDAGNSTIHVRATDRDGGASAIAARTVSVLPWNVVVDAVTGTRDLSWGGTADPDFLVFHSVGPSDVRVDAVVGEAIASTDVSDVTGKIVVYGHAGADTLVAFGVSHGLVVDAGADNDELFLIGTSGAATLSGGDGDDKFNLIGTTSNAALFGDAGNDEFNLVSAAAGVVSFQGSAGDDVLAITGASNAMSLSLHGDAGDDTLYVGDPSLTIGVLLDGGDGNDIILGGAGADIIDGGDGHDLIFASVHGVSGADTIRGGAGDDMIIRAIASASIVGGGILDGGSGHDLIVAGRVGFDDLQASITLIYFGEWLSARSFAEKVAHVTGTPGGDNGAEYLLADTTVLDDGAIDAVMGGPDADLVFCSLEVDVTPDVTAGMDVVFDLDV